MNVQETAKTEAVKTWAISDYRLIKQNYQRKRGKGKQNSDAALAKLSGRNSTDKSHGNLA